MTKPFLFIFFFFCFSALVLAEELSLSITTDKTEYSVGEEVLLTVTFTPLKQSLSFFDTSIYITASDKGNYLSFNEGTSFSVDDSVYPILSKNEKTGSFLNSKGTYYGWWIFATSAADKITLTGSKTLAKFNAKIIASADTSTEVELAIDSRSKIITYGAGFAEERLPLKLSSVKITILPSGNFTVAEETPLVIPEEKVLSSGSSSCTESWACSEWSNCIEGQQLRVCKDERKCSTVFDKPKELQTCTEEVIVTPPVKQTVSTLPKKPSDLPKTTPSTQTSSLFWTIIIAIIMVVIVIVILLLLVLKKKRSEPLENTIIEQLRPWLEQQRQRGILDEQSKQFLLQQGWQEDQLEEAFKRIT